MHIQNKFPHIKLTTPEEIETFPGLGLTGEVNNYKVVAGNSEFLQSFNMPVPQEV